jgi:hypothetical protein
MTWVDPRARSGHCQKERNFLPQGTSVHGLTEILSWQLPGLTEKTPQTGQPVSQPRYEQELLDYKSRLLPVNQPVCYTNTEQYTS